MTETNTQPTIYPTLAISRKVRDRLKIQAALEGSTMREVAEEAILKHLNQLGTPKPGSQKGSKNR